MEDAVIAGKTVIHIYVPESSQVHRCNDRIYDRNEDGDFDITDHTRQVAQLYHRKQITYSENKIYPFVGLTDLRADLIAKCRKLAGVFREDHPWVTMDDMELLKSAQIYQTDPETGKSGITLAGILLLGKDNVILSAVPHHRTDLILRKINTDRYDDRDLVITNLIESYERVISFITKHLPDPFFLEGIDRISIRDAIFREVASNILIHREYRNPFPAKLIIERGKVRTENSNNPHGFGALNPATFTPFPKNPVIGRFFREIGRADELGSGMRKLMKYGKVYGGSDPEMTEGDIFQIVVPVPEFQIHGIPANGTSTTNTNLSTAQVTAQVTSFCIEPKSAKEIMASLGLKHWKNFQIHYLKPLLENGILERTIPDKPQSRLQKYRSSEKWKGFKQEIQVKK